jgi:uncharacterized MnhB-related membrane protein
MPFEAEAGTACDDRLAVRRCTGAGLVLMAWRIVVSDELFKSIVFFIAFGLLMAVAWTRLAAPHVALAEAAIGAGITGALLLTAYRDMLAGRKPDGRRPRARMLSAAAARAGRRRAGDGALALALLQLPPAAAGAGALARARIGEAGVQEHVTAVLLDFRAYDTLLEMGVLLLAVIGAQAVLEAGPQRVPDPWGDRHREPAMVAPLISLLSR